MLVEKWLSPSSLLVHLKSQIIPDCAFTANLWFPLLRTCFKFSTNVLSKTMNLLWIVLTNDCCLRYCLKFHKPINLWKYAKQTHWRFKLSSNKSLCTFKLMLLTTEEHWSHCHNWQKWWRDQFCHSWYLKNQ